MSAHSSLVSLSAIVITGISLLGAVGPVFSPATAQDRQWETTVHPSPATTEPPSPPHKLDANDEIAALERIQYALSEVGDGNTYVWRRWHGRLAGVLHPTASFKDRSGKVCRHLVVLMTTGQHTKKMEGIACRLPTGRWQLQG